MTGSFGFLGRAILDHAPEGVTVIATDRDVTGLEIPGVACRQLNVVDCTAHDLKGVDVVIHNAGLFDLTATRETLMQVNVVLVRAWQALLLRRT